MRYFLLILIYMISMLVTGCGGAGNSDDPKSGSVMNTKLDYQGKKEFAKLDGKELLEYVRAIHLFESLDLDFFSDNVETQGKKVENNIDPVTGLGTLVFTFQQYQECCTNRKITGKVIFKVLSSDPNKHRMKFRMDLDNLYIEMPRRVIRFSTNVEGWVNNLNDKMYNMQYNDVYLYDSKYNAYYWFQDILTDNGITKGSLYVSSKGYVNFESDDQNNTYELEGKNHKRFKISYTDKNKIKVSTNAESFIFYTLGLSVVRDLLPVTVDDLKEDSIIIFIHNEYDDTNLTALVTNSKLKTLPIEYTWYVNGQLIENHHQSTLSRKFFKRGDNVKVESFLLSEDEKFFINKMEDTIPNVQPVIKFKPSVIKSNGLYSYKTNTLTFNFDFVDVYDPDGDPVTYEWFKGSNRNAVTFQDGSDMKRVPKVQIEKYGRYNLGFSASDGISKQTKRFEILFESDLLEKKVLSLKGYHLNSLSVADVDGNGFSDIVVLSDNPEKMIIFYQESADEFRRRDIDLPDKMEIVRSGDFNHDGLTDFVFARHGDVGIWYQNSDGMFADMILYSSLDSYTISDIFVADFDKDGLDDIGAFVNAKLYIHYQRDAFRSHFLIDVNKEEGVDISYFQAAFITKGDINTDDRVDFALPQALYIQEEFGSYTSLIYEKTKMITNSIIYDFDKDGLSDIVAVEYLENNFLFYKQEKDHSFKSGEKIPLDAKEGMFSQMDFDGDAEKELALLTGGEIYLYKYLNGKYMTYLVDFDTFIYAPQKMIIVDLNNDGKDDMIFIAGSTIYIEQAK